MRFYGLLLGLLGVWRVTHLLHAEDGPWNLFSRMRRRLRTAGRSAAVDCFYCLSVWVAVAFAWSIASIEDAGWGETLLLWPALSAGAIAVERLAMGGDSPTTTYHEDHEEHREGH